MLSDSARGDTRIAKAEIAESSLGGSLMPANLVATLSRDECFILVRYLIELNHHDNRTQSLQSGSP